MILLNKKDVYNVLTDVYHHQTPSQHIALAEALDKVPPMDVIPIAWMEDEIEVLKNTVVNIPNFKTDYWLLKDEIESLETVLRMWREEKCGADC